VRITVRFFSHLRDLANTEQLGIALPEGSRVLHLLAQVYREYPALAAVDKTILIGAGVEFVERDYLLKEGEEIALMPPVQGG
jgi:molybdopterin converting factor small subunit